MNGVDVTIRVSFTNADNEDLNGFYAEARERYTTWTATLVDRLKEYGMAKAEIEEYERQMDEMVALWVLNGELSAAKNEREREAILTGLKRSDPDYQGAQQPRDTLRSHLLTQCEPGLEEAKYLRRLAEEDCRWATASLAALAGVVEAGKNER